jgi:hypothetical protein
MNQVLDNPFYYLDNFQRVLDWIEARYRDLLDAEEARFVAAFPALPRSARALFVRMVMRKGSVFRLSKLNYAEIGRASEAAQQLLPSGWVGSDPVLGLDQLFELLTKAEIGDAFALDAHQRKARKSEQLQALRGQFSQPRPFSAWMAEPGDGALQLLVKPLCDRLRLIFFGNDHQDWQEFVLSDLGIYRYEQVALAPAARGFRSRHDIDAYLYLQQCRERVLAGQSDEDEHQALTTLRYDNPWLDSRRQRLVFLIGQAAEKAQDWRRAHSYYVHCQFPPARARAIRVLEKDAQVGAAHALAQQALAAPHSEAELQQLQRIAPRLARKLGLVRPQRQAAPPVPELHLALDHPASPVPVEEVVRAHLQRPEAPVFYVENALINALFGLLCWDAIFAPIPGAFFHPFHHGPADLHSLDFVARRQLAFDACLAQLDDGRYRDTIRARLAAKRAIESPFVLWDQLPDDLIELALACIPAAHLRRWCERILRDIGANRSGFPDLVQFWPQEQRYRMIEVKGPGDRLQDSQLRAIAYCNEHAMPVAVCYLQWRS